MDLIINQLSELLPQIQNLVRENAGSIRVKRLTIPSQIDLTQLRHGMTALDEVSVAIQQMVGTGTQFLQGMELIGNQLWELFQHLATINQDTMLLWKFQQQRILCGIKIKTKIELRQIQESSQRLIDLNDDSIRVLHVFEKILQNNINSSGADAQVMKTMKKLTDKFEEAFTHLVKQCFIVVVQPRQVLCAGSKVQKGKKITEAPVIVSLLASNLKQNTIPPPVVKLWIIREQDALLWFRYQSDQLETGLMQLPPQDKFLVEKAAAEMKYCPETGRFTAQFSGLVIKDKLIRAHDEMKKSPCSVESSVTPTSQNCRNHSQQNNPVPGNGRPEKIYVSEEKLYMFFQTEICVRNRNIQIDTISFPIVLTYHPSQDPLGEITVHWVNAFSEIERPHFQVESAVTWNQLLELIRARFWAKTGLPLVRDPRVSGVGKAEVGLYLKELFSNYHPNIAEDELISRRSFCKTPDQENSFWHWIYSAIKTLREDNNLLTLWELGHLLGFVSGDTCEELLKNSVPGTFILRFSETRQGVIVISFVTRPEAVEDLQVDAAKGQQLYEIIKNNPILQFSYPYGTPKATILGNLDPTGSPLKEKKRLSIHPPKGRQYVETMSIIVPKGSSVSVQLPISGAQLDSRLPEQQLVPVAAPTSSATGFSVPTEQQFCMALGQGYQPNTDNYENPQNFVTSSTPCYSSAPDIEIQTTGNINHLPADNMTDLFDSPIFQQHQQLPNNTLVSHDGFGSWMGSAMASEHQLGHVAQNAATPLFGVPTNQFCMGGWQGCPTNNGNYENPQNLVTFPTPSCPSQQRNEIQIASNHLSEDYMMDTIVSSGYQQHPQLPNNTLVSNDWLSSWMDPAPQDSFGN